MTQNYQCTVVDDAEKCSVVKFMKEDKSYIAKTCIGKGKIWELIKSRHVWGYLFSACEQIDIKYTMIYLQIRWIRKTRKRGMNEYKQTIWKEEKELELLQTAVNSNSRKLKKSE